MKFVALIFLILIKNMVLIGKMYEMKKVINIVLLVLLIILVTFSLGGLIYSIFY